MTGPDTLAMLRQINANLRTSLVSFGSERSRSKAYTPPDFSKLRGLLLQRAECLRHSTPSAIPCEELHQEILEYGGILEKLKQTLPNIHKQLLTEQSRVKAAQGHLAHATAWAKAKQGIL